MARHYVQASSQFLESSSPPVTAYPFTISFWMKLASNTDCTPVSICDNASSQNYWEFHYDAASTKLSFISRAGTAFPALINVAMSTATWYHICGVGTSATARAAYLGGANKVTDANSSTPSTPTRYGVGRRSRSVPDEYFDGDIGDVTIWNVALTDAEVEALGRGVHPRRVRGASIVSYHPLWGNASPEPDMTASGPDLTVTSATQATSHPPVQPIFFAPFQSAPFPVVTGANQSLLLVGVG